MAGKKVKGSTTAKASSAPSGQRDLFHFYQKQSKVTDEVKAPNAITVEAVASGLDGSSDSRLLEPKEVLLKESEVSSSESNEKQRQNVKTNGALIVDEPLPDCMRVSEDLQSTTSEDFAQRPPQPFQAIITTIVSDKSTSQVSNTHNSGRLMKSPRQKAYAIFETSGTTSKSSEVVHAGSSGQTGSSSKPLSRVKQLMKEDSGVAAPRDVIDLTQSPGGHHKAQSNPKTSAHEQQDIVVADDDGPSTAPPSGSQDAPIDLSSSPPAESRPAKVLHPFFARHATKKTKDNIPNTSRSISSISKQMEAPWPNAEHQHITGPQTSFWASGSSKFGKYRTAPAHVWFTAPSNLRFLEDAGKTQPPLSRTCTAGVEPHAPTPVECEAVLSSLPSAHREHPGISRLFSEPPGIKVSRIVKDGEMWSHRWRPRRAAEVLGNEENARYLKAWLQALEIGAGDNLQGAAADAKGKTAQNDIRGTKRPTMVRAVTKKRGRKRRRLGSDDGSSVEDWIVDDNEEATGESESDSDNDSPLDWASSGGATRSNISPNLHARHTGVVEDASSHAAHNAHDETHSPEFSTLTNTILLAGPSGSGKTSTIYACAEELGWEVFEVHPGIGKRSGGNISSLVGDVGKNHLVGRRGGSGTYMKRSSNQSGFGYLTGEGEKEDATQAEDGKRSIRQSIILLDEVDILFKEDVNFWPTVVNIIKTSHRPVFMTCNDISLIPQDDLPLQTCLHFQPCASPLAVSFLQCVCLAEGYIVPRKQLETVYAKTYTRISCDEPDEPSVPYPSQPPPSSDLRRALNELQLCCSRDFATLQIGDETAVEETEIPTIAPGIITSSGTEVLADWTHPPDVFCGSFPEGSPLEEYDVYRIGKHAECASYIDGYLERRSSDELEALAIDRYGLSGDDEIGYILLEKPALSGRSGGLAFYNRDADMAREALAVSRHVLETSGAGARVRGSLRGRERGTTRFFDSRSLARARVANQTQAVSFLDDVITLSGPLLPRPAAVLEYTAYVRQMILVDDVLEAEAAKAAVPIEDETRQRRGRPARRRWQMGEYPRYLSVSAEGLDAARNMLLS